MIDLVIVGAGWAGLAAAKVHLDLHPDSNLVVLDANPTIGGVWAKHRLFPGLKSNNLLGTYEFSDFPMTPEKYPVKVGQHISGEAVHAYLEDYAKHFDIYRRIRFNTKLDTVEREPGAETGWLLTVHPTNTDANAKPEQLHTAKLIIATGLTSQPNLPTIPGSTDFQAPLFHSYDLPKHLPALKTASRVTVYGGTKSAWDAAYHFATHGSTTVDMVIRASGHGPCWMAPTHVTPGKIWLELLVNTRLLTWFSPCAWGDADGHTWARYFLQRTRLGRLITKGFFAVLGNDVLTLNGYAKHPETAKLKPWIDPFWVAAGLSILNYDTDFFALVREGKIRVHIADITNLTPHTVHLSTGEELPSDALVACTGWLARPPITFSPPSLEASLNLPTASLPPSDAALEARADAEILQRFPGLKNQPPPLPAYKPLTGGTTETIKHPYRLYRFMVPPAHLAARDIAFIGMQTTVSNVWVYQTQALWLAAHFAGKLPSLSPAALADPVAREKREYETMLVARFGKWRTPGGLGGRFPDFVFDSLPYLDLLLGELGVESRRGRGVVSPYRVGDYAGVVDEWRVKNGSVGAVNGGA